jgi:hypothetical protein
MDVYNAVMIFLNSFWLEINGRIFLTTFIAYTISYMIYSGYMSWFAGGYGGILLTQVGFSIIDLLGLIPMAFLLLAEWLKSFLRFAVKIIVIYIAIPFVLLVIIYSAMQFWGINVFPGNSFVFTLGMFIWVGGVFAGFFTSEFKEHKWLYRLPLIACYIGVILAALTTPFSSSSSINQHPSLAPQIQWVLRLILNICAIVLSVIFFVIPFATGMRMGEFAAKQKLLSRIKKIILSQPIDMIGTLSVKNPRKKKTQSEANDKFLLMHGEKTSPLIWWHP